MSIKKCFNLFNQFDKLDSSVKYFCESIYKITIKNYSNSDSLLKFDETKYRQTYKDWGDMGIFNHSENQIDPLLYGMINYNIEKIDSSLRSGYSVQSSLVINPIEKFGNNHIKDLFLDKLYSGQHIGCFGLTEPESGFDPSSMRTTAKENKDYYIVNGSKVWITNSPIADVFVIWCKDENNKIIGLVTERNDAW